MGQTGNFFILFISILIRSHNIIFTKLICENSLSTDDSFYNLNIFMFASSLSRNNRIVSLIRLSLLNNLCAI